MNIATFFEPLSVSFRKSAGGATITFEAGKQYVIANAQLDRIVQDQTVRDRIYKVSKLEHRLANFHVSAARKLGRHRVLLYNGSGGYGDQIVTWPLARLLHTLGFEVHILTDPGNNLCWWNFPWIKTVNMLPCPWEFVKMFDDFICFETVVNTDEHQDQDHPLDVMLNKIGVEPSSIAAELKVVRPNFTFSEAMSVKQHNQKPFGIYQLSAANTVRCLPPSESVFMAVKLAEAFPDLHWFALWDEFVPPAYKETLEAKIKELNLTNLVPFTTQNLRELWALAEVAKVVVAPDSMMVHVAGSLGTPCVGLWGPVAPTHRVKYYANHVPIWPREFCPHAPCFCYAATFPKFCPPRPGGRNICEVLAGISPFEVIEKVKEIKRA